MKIVWSKEALQQLIEIERFIAKDSPERAVLFVDRLIERAEKIKTFPFKGRIVPDFSTNEIREVFEKVYRIVYRISKNKLEILTVFEGCRLLTPSDIKKDK